MKTQRIIFYTQLAYQLLGTNSDIVPYSEFLSAFDDLAALAEHVDNPSKRATSTSP
jgi:hypothetical protein